MYFFRNNAPKLVDTAKTSKNGYLAGEGNGTKGGGDKLTLTKKTFGPKGHRQVCQSDGVSLPWRPGERRRTVGP